MGFHLKTLVSILFGSVLIWGIHGDGSTSPSGILLRRLSNEVDIKLQAISTYSDNANNLLSHMKTKIQELEVKTSNTNAINHELESEMKELHAINLKLESKIQELEVKTSNTNAINFELESKIQEVEATLSEFMTDVKENLTPLQSFTSLSDKFTEFQQKVNKESVKLRNLRLVVGSNGHIKGFWKMPVVDLYYYSNHTGRTEKIDLSSCTTTSCCENLVELSENSFSMDTHGSCVIMYYEKDCVAGTYRVYYPGSISNHADFGANKNKYKSIGTCY